MKKVTIEIEDVGDEAACVNAASKLFTALVDRHGERSAMFIWTQTRDLSEERRGEYWRKQKEWEQTRDKWDRALEAANPPDLGDERILLELFVMKEQKILGLARELTRRNTELRKAAKRWELAVKVWEQSDGRNKSKPCTPPSLYGPTGSTSIETMRKHIHRLLDAHADWRKVLVAAPPEFQQFKLRRTVFADWYDWQDWRADEQRILGDQIKLGHDFQVL